MNAIKIGDELTKNLSLLKVTLTNCNRLNYCDTALVDLERSRDEVLAVTKNITHIFNTIALGQDTWTKAELVDLFNREMSINMVRQYSIWVNTDGHHNWSLYGVGAGTSFEEACESFFNGLPINRKFDKTTMTVEGRAVKSHPGE
ncbi:hypothetical protein PP187_gp309 [Klebsiella phage vB_KvM-Eowyn]|uniref:Uncharacterized protein n=1 Tax=Klebsiella phage vB_KvM-Eowyn TaxID=2762819 RepID=A0A7R8R9S0_9CAUD|nr:hypothetical protein PP187_gp309 [Klebsiella phage vB_KvM-Eowyn]CAD5236298.1 hypothetical protein LLCLJKAH_00309 [Klebsiella phage vB_KvM-Eowyn]